MCHASTHLFSVAFSLLLDSGYLHPDFDFDSSGWREKRETQKSVHVDCVLTLFNLIYRVDKIS